jgi:hypothetical protein
MKITRFDKGKKKTIVHGLGDKALKQYDQKPSKK